MFDNWHSDITVAAREIAGNWKQFQSFGWSSKPEYHPEDYAILYLTTRDSGLTSVSNAHAVLTALEDIDNWHKESHSHWAYGHIDGIVVRCVTSDGSPTEAFRILHGLAMAMADYPLLDENDYSDREYEATCEAIAEVGRSLVSDTAPDSWPSDCYSWFSDHNQSAIESSDDHGGYPTKDQMSDALEALGYGT